MVMPMVMYVDGRIVAPDEPVLRADDHALVGDGAFEAIKVVDGRPFALTRHLTRLRRSQVRESPACALSHP